MAAFIGHLWLVMKIEKSLSDAAGLGEIGRRLAAGR
jgi:hypothetical protein